jgi:hypothetical protein
VGAFWALAALITHGASARVTARPRALVIFIDISSPAFSALWQGLRLTRRLMMYERFASVKKMYDPHKIK